MKKQVYRILPTMILVCAFAAGSAHAQYSYRSKLTAEIPFEFSVGGTTLPAGEYQVSAVSESSNNMVFQLRNRTGGAVAMSQAMRIGHKDREEPTRLVFECYGDRYFLTEIWIDNENGGLRLTKSNTERQKQRELAGNKPEIRSVAAWHR